MKRKGIALTMVLMLVMVLGFAGCAPEEEPPVDEPQPDEEPVDEPAEPEGTISDIIGIDPGAGIMASTEEAVDVYELEAPLIEGSDAAMTAELSTAIANEEWIVVTGWTPHWKFAEWDLKFLEDPENVYGDEEYIATVAREDMEADHPEVYELLENFHWGDDEIGAVMEMNAEDADFMGNAQTWIDENRDMVDEWIPEGLEGDGETVEMLMVEWECAIAASHVMAAVLEEAGYEVDITSVDAGVMWSSIAEGDADFMVCGWLPSTHEAYLDEFGDQVDEVRANYEGARIGLVVPEYMPIDSIEEINDYVE